MQCRRLERCGVGLRRPGGGHSADAHLSVPSSASPRHCPHTNAGEVPSPASPRHRPHANAGEVPSPASPRRRPHVNAGEVPSTASPRHRTRANTGRDRHYRNPLGDTALD